MSVSLLSSLIGVLMGKGVWPLNAHRHKMWKFIINFWATVCKTVRPMLSDHCLSFMAVCDIWMDQDETRYGGRCYVRWGPSSTQRGTASLPQFSAHVLCGQMAGWINMPLGMQVGLGPGDNGPSSPTWANPKRAQQCPLFSAGVCYGQGHPSQLLLSSCFLIHD